MSTLKLADNLIIPIGAAMAARGGQRIAIIGKSGSGKTNTQLVLAKEWLENGWPLVCIDPMNGYRTLRDAGLPVLIAGARKSADIFLSVENAGRLAEFSYTERISIILDLSLYEDGEDIRVLEAFLDPFWRMFRNQDEDAPILPFALFIDEAHLYVPQTGITDVTYLINNMGKMGRQLGLSIFFSTQTPTDVQKKFLKQRNIVIAHNVTGSDIGIVAEVVSQPQKDIRGVLKNFMTGEAIVTGDADLLDLKGEDYLLTRIFKWQVTTNPLSVALRESPQMRPIDQAMLQQLQETMKRPAHRVDDRDALIAELQRHIRELKDEIERLRVVQPTDDEEVLIGAPSGILQPTIISENGIVTKVKYDPKPTPAIVIRPPSVVAAGTTDPLLINTGSRRILQTLARIHPLRITRAQLGTLADYKITGGTFLSNFGSLKKSGFIVEKHLIDVTQAGFSYLGMQPREIPNTKDELLSMWQAVLKLQEWLMLSHLISEYPSSISKEELAIKIGMTASGGAFNSYLGNLRRNDLVEPGETPGTFSANGEMLLL